MKALSSIAYVVIITVTTIPRATAKDTSTNDIRLEKMTITGSRIPQKLSTVSRSITVIDQETIQNSPASSVADLLESVAGVDVRQRGADGVQADVSIRGGTFEQALIMIDGVKVSNPQTGHHNLDVPVAKDEIERIEILRGHGSRLYGPNAFAGVVNIVTKKHASTHISVTSTIGKHAFRGGSLSGALSSGPTTHRAFVSKALSNGHRPNTDFDNLSGSYRGTYAWVNGDAAFTAAYSQRDFGANGFYFDGPNQREETKSLLLIGQTNLHRDNVLFGPKLSWNRHVDQFNNDYTNPALRNEHTTHVISLDAPVLFTSPLGTTAAALDVAYETIESSNLGNHDRARAGVILEHPFSLWDKLTITPGASAYYYSAWGAKAWPGLDIGFTPHPDIHLFATSGFSFRVPSYTELYYMYPGYLEARSDLVPEQTISYEFGMKGGPSWAHATVSCFMRDGTNLIDWVRTREDGPWRTKNHTYVGSRGVDVDATLRPNKLWNKLPVYSVRGGYSYLNLSKSSSSLQSRYVLDYLRHKAFVTIDHKLVRGLRHSAQLRYERRVGSSDYAYLLDSRVSLALQSFCMYVEGTNLLDQEHYDIATAPLPGRGIRTGLTATLKKKD